MARIRESESREFRMRALLHGYEVKDDGSVRAKSRVRNASHDYLERNAAKWARRGH